MDTVSFNQLFVSDEGVVLTISELDGRPGVTSGSLLFSSPAEAKAYYAYVSGQDW